MNSFIYIFATYMLAIALVPCADSVPLSLSAASSVTQTAPVAQHNDGHNGDHCSALCFCICCHSHFLDASYTDFSRIIDVVDSLYRIESSFPLDSYPLSPFRPPKA